MRPRVREVAPPVFRIVLSFIAPLLITFITGEIIIRRSLEKILPELNVHVDIMKSDLEFESCQINKYDFIVLDPWTWATKGGATTQLFAIVSIRTRPSCAFELSHVLIQTLSSSTKPQLQHYFLSFFIPKRTRMQTAEATSNDSSCPPTCESGWVPKPNIRGLESKVYILDFFGSPKLKGNSFNIRPDHILTAFGSPWNAFLGTVDRRER